ncbi:hypothetical protein B0H21DRAFT_693071, partial [Amylocystis lapponica]
QDTVLLDQIKLRNLLDTAQERLGRAANPVDSGQSLPLAWRDALRPSQDTGTRLLTTRSLLQRPGIQLDDCLQSFIASEKGVALAVECRSTIRDQGTKVAHDAQSLSRKIYEASVSRHPNPEDIEGLNALLDLVCF